MFLYTVFHIQFLYIFEKNKKIIEYLQQQKNEKAKNTNN